jgi:YjjG family noncanonical pyrimidine nucleotidase
MKFDAVFIDADNTLFDFDKTQEKAMSQSLNYFKLPTSEEVLKRYEQINAQLWAQYHDGELQNHEINPLRWHRWLDELGLSTEVDFAELAEHFANSLAEQCVKEPGADELMAYLTAQCPVHVITNGFPSSQKYRWHKAGWHEQLHGITVSAEVGIQKPHPDIFHIAMASVGVTDSSRCLMIGDSLEADVQGPQLVGLKACWYQRKNAKNSTQIKPDFTVSQLTEILDIMK